MTRQLELGHENRSDTAETSTAAFTEAVSNSKSASLAFLYGPIRKEIEEVEEILCQEVASKYPIVDKIAQHGLGIGGKRLRPSLLLLAAKACGEINKNHLRLAAVMEMIHTATLIHDDVLDEATLRRHQSTVNAKAGNEMSVLLGDYLFSNAFYLASTSGSTYACEQIGRATNIVCEGEMRQIASRGNFQLGEEEYLDIIDAKTAELCSCCSHLGAHFSGADEPTQAALASYGRNLGIAFQIVDDLLDVVGDEQQTGKTLGTDLELEKLTLPVIRLLAVSNAEVHEQIRAASRLPAAERRVSLRRWMQSSDALQYTRQRALEYAGAARDCLVGLPNSDAREVLEGIPRFVVERQR